MNRFRFRVCLLGAWMLFLQSVAVATDKAAAPLPIEQMRAVAYTKAFAKRFALPDPEPGTEPEGGIQAMEFAVEDAKAKYPRKKFATYQCVLKLYLDSQLPIAYPEGGVAGGDHMLMQPSHFFMWPNPENKRWLSLSEKDRLHFNERDGRYMRMTWLATPDYEWQKRGAATGMFYEEYHRDLFPGLAYLKIRTGCPAYSWIDKVDTVQIWMKREGAKDYRKQLRTDPDDFLKATIPKSFYHQIIPWIKQASAFNQQLIDEANAKRRAEQASKHAGSP